jgi:hypothetical protein
MYGGSVDNLDCYFYANSNHYNDYFAHTYDDFNHYIHNYDHACVNAHYHLDSYFYVNNNASYINHRTPALPLRGHTRLVRIPHTCGPAYFFGDRTR